MPFVNGPPMNLQDLWISSLITVLPVWRKDEPQKVLFLEPKYSMRGMKKMIRKKFLI